LTAWLTSLLFLVTGAPSNLIASIIVLFIGGNDDDQVSRHQPVAAEYVSLPSFCNKLSFSLPVFIK